MNQGMSGQVRTSQWGTSGRARGTGCFPVVTVTVLAVTALFTTLQFFYPRLLTSLERQPGALVRDEWWRRFTPLLVHDGGWRQISFNFPAICVVSAVVQRAFGGLAWLLRISHPVLLERSPATDGIRRERATRSLEQVCWVAVPYGCCLNCEGHKQRLAPSSS